MTIGVQYGEKGLEIKGAAQAASRICSKIQDKKKIIFYVFFLLFEVFCYPLL
jgi:hypothetical protein